MPFLFVPLLTYAQTTTLITKNSNATTTERIAHVPILIYHSVRPYYPGITNLVKEYTVPPDIFEDQLKYLRDNGYTPVTLDNLSHFFADGTSLPPKPVMITLDDGWENQYVYAFPLLKKYKFPGIFYVYPGAIGKKHFLTYPEIKEMIAGGMFIADHTQTHPELTKISQTLELKKEIVDSREILEKELGVPIRDFAYPFGAYNYQCIKMVMQSGYRTARTVHGGLVENSLAPYTIDGIIITGDFNRFVSWVNK